MQTQIPSVDTRPEPDVNEYFPHASEVHLRDYWYVVLKRRWLILAVFLVVTSFFSMRAMMRKPTYSATSVLQIDRGRINIVQDVMIQDYLGGYTEFYPTQQRVLRSRTLARRVVNQLRLWEHPAFGGSSEPPSDQRLEDLAGAVQGMLRVAQIRSTQLMEVSFTSLEPQLAADLANALAQQYMSFHSENETDLARNTAGFIREQVQKIQHEIQEKENKLQEYSTRKDLLMVDEKELMAVQQLEELHSELTQARAARAAAEARYQSLRSAHLSALPDVQNDASVNNLKAEQAELQRQISELSSKFKGDWPELQRARQALEELGPRLEQRQREVASKLIGRAQVDFQEARGREALIAREVETQKLAAQELGKLTTDYNQIKAEIDNQRTMLQQLLRRHSETGLSAELGEQTPVNVRIVEAALVPRGANGPGMKRSVMLGALIGLGLALGLSFFLDYWETNIHTVDDLRRHVPLPYLGMVPRHDGQPLAILGRAPAGAQRRVGDGEYDQRSKSLGRTRSALSVSQHSRLSRRKDETSIIAERFKFLRGSLLLSSAGGPPRTVLITGPDKNAGKTFVSCNLAASLADLNKKVLLIDADLRNPQLHKVFRFKNRIGLSNVLSGQTSIEKGCIFSTPLANVYILLAGPPSPSPAELLGSTKLEETLSQCISHFDYVLLDSAPLLPVFDSHVLTARCDASLMVVRSGHTSRHAVRTSLELIDRVGGKVTGVVLNDVNLADYAQNYYYTYHSYEYGTYAEETVEQTAG